MDPNSQHQLWSRWTFDVQSERLLPNYATLKTNLARFARKGFGAATEMKIDVLGPRVLRVQVRTEGHPAHDPQFKAYMEMAWDQFFKAGLGLQTTSTCQVKVEAGDLQDGKPREQLLILPPLRIM